MYGATVSAETFIAEKNASAYAVEVFPISPRFASRIESIPSGIIATVCSIHAQPFVPYCS